MDYRDENVLKQNPIVAEIVDLGPSNRFGITGTMQQAFHQQEKVLVAGYDPGSLEEQVVRAFIFLEKGYSQVSMSSRSFVFTDIPPIDAIKQYREKTSLVKKEEIEKLLESLKKEPDTVNFSFDKKIKKIVDTSFYFISKGIFNTCEEFQKNFFYSGRLWAREINDDLDNEHLIVHIPVQWCKYNGFNNESVEFILKYLAELFEECSYQGLSELKEFEKHISLLNENLHYNFFINGNLPNAIKKFLVSVCLSFTNDKSHFLGTAYQIKQKTSLDFINSLVLSYNLYQDKYFGISIIDSKIKILLPTFDKEVFEKRFFKLKNINSCLDYIVVSPSQHHHFSEMLKAKKYKELLMLLLGFNKIDPTKEEKTTSKINTKKPTGIHSIDTTYIRHFKIKEDEHYIAANEKKDVFQKISDIMSLKAQKNRILKNPYFPPGEREKILKEIQEKLDNIK